MNQNLSRSRADRRSSRGNTAVFIVAALALSCGDAGAGRSGAGNGGPDIEGVGPMDTGAETDGGATRPDSGDADGAGADTGAGAGAEYGETCDEDADCASMLCIQIVPGAGVGFCSEPCGGICADEGSDCVLVTNSGGDATRVCVPRNYCLDRDGDEHGHGPGCRGPDCDDTLPSVYMGAPELCDGIDNNCNGTIDENVVGTGEDCATGYDGACGPGRWRCRDMVMQCESVTAPSEERCNGIDDDCNGLVDDDPVDAPTWYRDADGDRFGDPNDAVRACTRPEGYVDEAGDCDDTDAAVNPVARETCDGVDNNCDGITDGPDLEGTRPWYRDADGDGYGDPDSVVEACRQPEGYVDNADDCDDDAGTTFPGAPEFCDGLDNNCSGVVDDGYADDEGIASCDGDPGTGCETDIASDTRNCGGCGIECPVGIACVEGVCGCPAGEIVCGGVCAAPNACGGCAALGGTPGASCGPCGTLVCGTTESLFCEGEANNACGGCGPVNNPTSGACGYCDTGAWTCTGDNSATCNGATNPMTDNANCGDCGVVCGAGRLCTNGTCQCPGDQITFTQQPGDRTTCAGADATFAATVTGAGLALRWQRSTDGGGTWTDLSDGAGFAGTGTASLTVRAPAAAASGHRFRVRVEASCSTGTSQAATLTVGTAPTAASASANPNPVCAGSPLTLTGAATGAASWSWSGPGGYSASTQSPTRTGITAAHAGTYTMTASNTCGEVSASTSAVTVRPATAITSQPAARTTCAGTVAEFSVAAAGESVAWRWQASTNGGTTWSDLSDGGAYTGTGTATLRVTAAAGLNGALYRARATGACGQELSNAVQLTVTGAPTGVSASASPNPVCAGSTLNLSGSATGATSWAWTGPGGYSATTQNASRGSVSTAHNGNYVLTATNSCGSTEASTASVTVNTAPTISSQPANQSTCAGSATSFTVGGSGTGLSWQWQVSTNGGSTWANVTNGGAYSGATAATLNVTPTIAFHNYRYRAIANGTCGSATSNAATLTVNGVPTGVSASASPNPVCAGSTLNLSGSATGATSWAWTGPGSYSATTQNASRGSVSTAHNGNYVLTATNSCGSTEASTASVTVNTAPTISSQPANQSTCAGSATSFTVGGSGTGLSWQWQVSTNGGSTWANVTNGGAYSGATAATLNVTPTIAFHNYRYRAIANGTCGSATSNAATLTVNGVPTGVSASASPNPVCAGSTLNLSGSATGATSWAWTGPGSYSATTQNASRGSVSTAHSGNYVLTATNSCGSANASTASVTVNTAPTITTQPANRTICAGSATSFTVAGSGTGLSWQWQVSTNGGSTWANVTNGGAYSGATAATLNVTPTIAFHNYRYRAIANGTCGSATSNAATLTVNGPPTGVSASATPNPICAGSTLSLSGSGSGVSSWSWSGPGSFASTSQSPTRNVTTSHGGTYTVTATNSCGSTQSSVNVTVNTCVAGQCGSANGGSTPTAPSSNLCAAGSASAVSGSGPYTWTCAGTGGASNASCSSNRSCTATPRTWTVSGATCSENLIATNHGGSRSVTDIGTPTVGSASFTCNQGTWSQQAGASCLNLDPLCPTYYSGGVTYTSSSSPMRGSNGHWYCVEYTESTEYGNCEDSWQSIRSLTGPVRDCSASERTGFCCNGIPGSICESQCNGDLCSPTVGWCNGWSCNGSSFFGNCRLP